MNDAYVRVQATKFAVRNGGRGVLNPRRPALFNPETNSCIKEHAHEKGERRDMRKHTRCDDGERIVYTEHRSIGQHLSLPVMKYAHGAHTFLSRRGGP